MSSAQAQLDTSARCHGYTVAWEGAALVITCACCGASRMTADQARTLLNPRYGLVSAVGRFITNARPIERRRLYDLIVEALTPDELPDWMQKCAGGRHE